MGAPLRFLVSVLITEEIFRRPAFPYATLAVNIVGSFSLAFLTWVAADRLGVNSSVRLLLGVGVLGAFTTYSTFSVETIVLFQRDRPVLALLYIVGSVVGTLVAAYAGMRLGRAF